jgi:3-oxoadipate:acetyl-CoA acetyltransferase
MYVKGKKAGKLIIQLAPNGGIPNRDVTPHVPITPTEIADDAHRAYQLGASVVHVHARDENGAQTFRKDVFEEIFSRIREKCPGIIICSTTSGRFNDDVTNRLKVLDLEPEMATLPLGTVNFFRHPSFNAPETTKKLAKRMYELGIKPELEIFEGGFINTAQYYVQKGVLKPPLHFNLLLGSLGNFPADIRDLIYLTESLPSSSTWTAAGIGRFQGQINAAAILVGGHVRTGIEDAIYYDHERRELATNEDLVKRVVRIANELGREIATPEEAREILKLA